MRKIAVFGSTGFVGRSSLKVIHHLKGKVSVLAARNNIDLLEEQIRLFEPELAVVWDPIKADVLQRRLPNHPILTGSKGIYEAMQHPSTELVLNAISGFEGVEVSLQAVQAGKDLALANKETLVTLGEFITDWARKKGIQLIPIDSEQTAIFQCLKGEDPKKVRRIILTGSGGPLKDFSLEQLLHVALEEALNHPHFAMGPKGTVDSSTLMNKGFEMIETHFLYDIPIEKIEVVIHPEQLIHSFVEFVDGSILAQMGKPDMMIPIQVALTYPTRMPGMLEAFDFKKSFDMHFIPWDSTRFRCLELAYESLRQGGSMPCFMNAANEILVKRFLASEIRWFEIGTKLEELMQSHIVEYPSQFEDFVMIDHKARELAQRI